MKTVPVRPLAAVSLLVLGSLGAASAQMSEAAKADVATQIAAARKANGAQMQQYNWNSRTEVLVNGEMKDTRLDVVNYLPNGQLQRTLVSDTPTSTPRGLLRKRIADDEKQKMQDYLTGLKALLDNYTLPTSGKILDFLNVAKPAGPDASGQFTITGSGVVQAGDSLTISVDMTTRKPTRMQVTTAFQGDPITLNATFRTLPSGLNYMAYAELDAPAKNLTIQISNFNYNRNS